MEVYLCKLFVKNTIFCWPTNQVILIVDHNSALILKVCLIDWLIDCIVLSTEYWCPNGTCRLRYIYIHVRVPKYWLYLANTTPCDSWGAQSSSHQVVFILRCKMMHGFTSQFVLFWSLPPHGRKAVIWAAASRGFLINPFHVRTSSLYLVPFLHFPRPGPHEYHVFRWIQHYSLMHNLVNVIMKS